MLSILSNVKRIIVKGIKPCPEALFRQIKFRKVRMKIGDLETDSFKNSLVCVYTKSLCTTWKTNYHHMKTVNLEGNSHLHPSPTLFYLNERK